MSELKDKLLKVERYRLFNIIKDYKLDPNYNDSCRYSDKKSDKDLIAIILKATKNSNSKEQEVLSDWRLQRIDTYCHINLEELSILNKIIRDKYPEISNSEIQRLIKQKAIKILGCIEDFRDSNLVLGISSQHSSLGFDEIDKQEYADFKRQLSSNPIEHKYFCLLIGKRKHVWI